MIEIVFRNGEVAHYKPSEYTEYRYDGKYFIVIKDCQWIGFYNLDCVECIEVEPLQTDCETCKHYGTVSVSCDRCDKSTHSKYEPQTERSER